MGQCVSATMCAVTRAHLSIRARCAGRRGCGPLSPPVPPRSPRATRAPRSRATAGPPAPTTSAGPSGQVQTTVCCCHLTPSATNVRVLRLTSAAGMSVRSWACHSGDSSISFSCRSATIVYRSRCHGLGLATGSLLVLGRHQPG